MLTSSYLLISAVLLGGTNEEYTITNLGPPVKAVTYGNSQGTVGQCPGGRQPAFYTSYYNTGGAELLAYDYKVKKVFRYDLPRGSGGYGLTTGTDGKIYIGMVGRGNLVEFDPSTQKIRDLGNAGQPTTYVWSCATSPDGKIFGAGYPKCIPLVYDPKTDKLTSPGSIRPRPGADYLRSVVADARGRAWFGVGTRAALVVYDPADGSHRDILPKQFAANSTVYQLARAGNRIYASILFSGDLLVFDAESCKFLYAIPPPAGERALLAAVSDSKGSLYAGTMPNGHLLVIRPGSSQPEKLFDYLGSVKSLLADRYLHAVFDNEHRIFDLSTRKIVDQLEWIEPKTGMSIFALTRGPAGKIYGSTYINQHFFRYDSASGKLEDLGRILRSGGQCDSMCCSRDGKRLWMGCYVQAHLSVYDPSRPHKLGTGPDCNPRDFGPVGKGQYRTKAIVEGPLGKIYCGSVPSYNSAPTGALTIFDPKTLRKNIISDLVPGGAVHALAAGDRFVYAAGGGELFALDPKTEKKVNRRKLSCSALVVASDGTLVVSAGDVQGFDPGTLETRWKIPFSQVDGLKGFHRLAAGPNGKLYGISNLGIFQIDVAGARFIRRTRAGSRHLAVDGRGLLYFASGANLLTAKPPGQQQKEKEQ